MLCFGPADALLGKGGEGLPGFRRLQLRAEDVANKVVPPATPVTLEYEAGGHKRQRDRDHRYDD